MSELMVHFLAHELGSMQMGSAWEVVQSLVTWASSNGLRRSMHSYWEKWFPVVIDMGALCRWTIARATASMTSRNKTPKSSTTASKFPTLRQVVSRLGKRLPCHFQKIRGLSCKTWVCSTSASFNNGFKSSQDHFLSLTSFMWWQQVVQFHF